MSYVDAKKDRKNNRRQQNLSTILALLSQVGNQIGQQIRYDRAAKDQKLRDDMLFKQQQDLLNQRESGMDRRAQQNQFTQLMSAAIAGDNRNSSMAGWKAAAMGQAQGGDVDKQIKEILDRQATADKLTYDPSSDNKALERLYQAKAIQGENRGPQQSNVDMVLALLQRMQGGPIQQTPQGRAPQMGAQMPTSDNAMSPAPSRPDQATGQDTSNMLFSDLDRFLQRPQQGGAAPGGGSTVSPGAMQALQQMQQQQGPAGPQYPSGQQVQANKEWGRLQELYHGFMNRDIASYLQLSQLMPGLMVPTWAAPTVGYQQPQRQVQPLGTTNTPR